MAEPVPFIVKRWGCPFCRRRYSHRPEARAHVARCWLNPDNRACKTCAHYSFDPGGDPCFPGRPCDCNQGGAECAAGIDLGPDDMPVTGCPLWALKSGTEGERHG